MQFPLFSASLNNLYPLELKIAIKKFQQNSEKF